MKAANKMYNEKPSKLSNLGVDVAGACRHNYDTYNNPEAKAAREKIKAAKDNRKELKQKAIDALNVEGCDFEAILCKYEMALALEKIKGYEGCTDGSTMSVSALKYYVSGLRRVPTIDRETFSDYVKAFNRMTKAISRVRYYITTLEAAQKHLAPKTKESFKEFNGVQRAWSLSEGEKLSHYATIALSSSTRAVQFGNSLTDSEREYCLHNLLESITLLNKHYNFDFKSYAFSFGARGVANSIAHYQDSLKVLAFNRGWSGAFAHELGHAVDYSLGLPSSNLPWELKRAYRQQLIDAKITAFDRAYYMKPKEIFARLFEVYLRSLIPDMSEFMQVTFSQQVMPKLDAESIAWMENALKPLIKAEN